MHVKVTQYFFCQIEHVRECFARYSEGTRKELLFYMECESVDWDKRFKEQFQITYQTWKLLVLRHENFTSRILRLRNASISA